MTAAFYRTEMDAQTHPCANLPRRTAVWCLVLFYLCVSSPFSVPVTVALGALDRGHQVLLGAGREGAPLVVLHHARSCPEHQHGILARTLTVFAKKHSTADADHVLELPTPANCVQTEKSEFSCHAVAIMTVATDLSGEALRENRSAALVIQSPRDERSPLRFLRSAQLLI